ncbi:MAG: phosphoglycerate dehydrogenase [Clostridia bacterium]|nr:phosphoglycerate dehydrogenase [Clostridia bacterium]
MYNIKLLNKISPVGTALFDKSVYNVGEDVENEDGILLRSADMHSYEMKENLLAIARSGAGTNNIPVNDCAEKGIVVFNTPGANANAVKELAICALLLSCRKISDAIVWAKSIAGEGDAIPKMVEKGKGQFVGPELAGKSLGIIGLGAIGAKLANIARSLGMTVYGYDPFITVDAAWQLKTDIRHALSEEEIYANCDFISMHIPCNDQTRGKFCAETFAKMKDGVRIINLARGELVNDDDMAAALESGKVACYVTDFPNAKTLAMPGAVCIPHLGASTPESEDNCAKMATEQMIDYLENGNIKNSVNFPNVAMERSAGSVRLCVIHRNIPNMISTVSAAMAAKGINIENIISKSKKDFAYTVLDVVGDVSDATLQHLYEVEGIIRVRVIK